MKKILSILVALVLAVLAAFFTTGEETEVTEPSQSIRIQAETAALPEIMPTQEAPENELPTQALPDPEGSYTTKEDVALYIHTYSCLPDNFITKKEARELGWEGGGLDDYAYGKCIGGDRFGNNEKLLPEDRSYIECDINTLHKTKRGAERLVFSEDCELIYYTDNHYESFELLYGEP